jgi:hypothetical protein
LARGIQNIRLVVGNYITAKVKQRERERKSGGILLGVVTIVHNPDRIDVCVLQHSIYIIAILVVTKDTIPRNFRKTWSWIRFFKINGDLFFFLIKVCVERLIWEKGKYLYMHAVKNIEREINKHIPGSLMNSEFRTNRKNLPSWAQTFEKEKKVKRLDQKMSEAPLK